MNKAIKFVIVSGIGFILDFIIYTILVNITPLNVNIANMISSLIGVTYVFIISTRKIFENNKNNIPLKYKYIIYVIYQIILILLASYCVLLLKNLFININIDIISKFSKILAKMFITPFTLTINYFAMKKLTKI